MTSGTSSLGRFITFEGPDGAGKSDQARRLAARLTTAGHRVTVTREPGGTTLGERIRGLLLDTSLDRSPEAEALLFNAARSELLSEVVGPALERGEIVVCDRFADSTLAYQGYGAGVDLGWLRALQRLATGGLVPHLTILLDVPVEVGLGRRAGGAPDELTRFEAGELHDTAFHERVRAGFRTLASDEPDRWRIVDGSADRDEVERRVAAAASVVVAPMDAPPDRRSEPMAPLLRTSR